MTPKELLQWLKIIEHEQVQEVLKLTVKLLSKLIIKPQINKKENKENG